MPFREAPFPHIPPLPESLRLLSKLSDDQFTSFVREIRGPDSFRRDRQRVEELRLKLTLRDTGDALGLLLTAKFLYDRSRGWIAPGESPADAVRSFLVSTELWSDLGEDPEATFSRVLTLVEPNPSADRERKREWLNTGLLPSAIEFSSFVDLRPSFSPERDSIDETLPVIIFGVETETPDGDDESFTFQLTPKGLRQLVRAVEDAQKKLDYLRRHYGSSMPIVFDDEQSR